ncbi:MAG: V-type ATP synthase subunit E family protein, partial [Candidatus Bathyarchaeia archaeon]
KEVEVKTGVSTTLMLSKEPVDIIGGAVLTSIDGTATVDNSIEARLKRVKEENQGEVEAILFS